ncbi:MAG: hypothetical protein NZ889_03060 [Candidatus Pacearchaeota archaeon]|nr:hypothetical protein [Candidatus Pacearchaeota archaeon]
MVKVEFGIFTHIINDEDTNDKKFFLEYEKKLRETKFVSEDATVMAELERRGLGKIILFSCADEETPKFSPSIGKFPKALKKLLQEKIATSEGNTIDVTDLLKIWLISHDITSSLTSSSSSKS